MRERICERKAVDFLVFYWVIELRMRHFASGSAKLPSCTRRRACTSNTSPRRCEEVDHEVVWVSSLIDSLSSSMSDIFDSIIDFSFAIKGTETQQHDHPPSCLRNNNDSKFTIDPCNDGYYSDATLSSSSVSSSLSESNRSVTFADNVVSKVKVIPRYDKATLSNLFYNRLDMQQFKCEARLEAMQIQVI